MRKGEKTEGGYVRKEDEGGVDGRGWTMGEEKAVRGEGGERRRR